ncbi:MAG: beta-lactamase family protein [Cellulosilyticum sp.]|nr:beta-lactamase family protein [Cellulosilyticum sp.]
METILGRVDCLPEETGYDSSRLEVLHRHFERIMKQKVICGAAYCISHKGKIIASASMGARNKVDYSDLMQPDTVFSIASITKLFTAVAIMQLVEEGLIRLDTPVGEILESFAEEPFKKITLWHLLTHTSGLYPDGGCFPESAPKTAWGLIQEKFDSLDAEQLKTLDWVQAGISAGLRQPVGSQWQYCTFGFVILGEVILKVSGQFSEDYIRDHILKPLNLNDSGFELSPEMARRHFIYNEEHKVWLQQIAEGKINDTEREDNPWRRVPNTGGGLHSTIYDLARFGNALLYGGRLDGARILGRKSIEKMTTVQLHNVPDYCWGANNPDRVHGIGFDMRQGPAFAYSDGSYMHEGAGTCSLVIDPKEELVVAWNVPFTENDWSALPLYNVQSIIWSGLI